MEMCGRADARHITVTLTEAKGASGITIHNFYVPAGGDIPNPDLNEKFRHKLQFMDEIRAWGGRSNPTGAPAILVGDLNVAPLEHDVWSHKQLLDVVSHTPVETSALERLRGEAGWVDAMRASAARAREDLFVVELSLARLGRRQQGPAARPHLGVGRPRADDPRHGRHP